MFRYILWPRRTRRELKWWFPFDCSNMHEMWLRLEWQTNDSENYNFWSPFKLQHFFTKTVIKKNVSLRGGKKNIVGPSDFVK